MELLNNLWFGLSVAASPINLIYCFIGVALGTAIGVLPGLGPAATMALLLPATYVIPPVSAIIMLSGIFYGAMYGGSTTSILLNLPGEAASVVTTLDGYQMALQGRAGPALGISAFGSFIAGTVTVIGLMLFGPPLAEMAIRFHPPEYFSLVLLALMLVAYLMGRSILKGVIMAILGLALAMVGTDPVTGVLRYNLGVMELADGIDFTPLVVGLFGVAEVLSTAEEKVRLEILNTRITNIYPSKKDWIQAKWAILRGSLIGFFVGILPGGGATISSFIAYAIEKKVSKTPEKFGTGMIEGVAAPESANNAGSGASFIPLLTLGIPGNPSIAMIFAAFLIHGIRPGPMLLKEHPDIFWGIIASMYIGNIMLLVLNLPLIGLFIKLLRVPYHYLGPLILSLCFIGAYSVSSSITDLWLVIFFGIIGYLFRKLEFPVAPLILAFVLGKLFETTLRQSLIFSRGSFAIFFNRPISGFFMILLCALIAITLSKAVISLLSRRPMSKKVFEVDE
jgi:putative tricarboxylic transport membrane protein